MARKNLLKGLMTPVETKSAAPAPAPSGEPRTKGAIGAVSASIAELKRRAIIDIDPKLIDAGGLQDRLEMDPDEDARLAESLRTYGQQVPVLVRPHPETPGRYQIVYGRRRVLALRDLDLPVRAMVRELDDRELVLAQGQENTARRDLSFIEKCNFARQMQTAGYNRKIICDALNIDKTLISRMLSVAERIPEQVLAAIGSAPSIGRDRWLKLADALEAGEWTGTEAAAMATGERSDERFDAVLKAVTVLERRSGEAGDDPEARRAKPQPEVQILRGSDGQKIGRFQRKRTSSTFTIERGGAGEFDLWLAENIEAIHRDWQKTRRGE